MAEQGSKRKLTTILSADAVGYSRLMGDDEEATIRTFTEYRDAITGLGRSGKKSSFRGQEDRKLSVFEFDLSENMLQIYFCKKAVTVAERIQCSYPTT
jgi:hypothetical protein